MVTRIHIKSHLVNSAGSEKSFWVGTLNIPDAHFNSELETAEWLFRYFNRVEDCDVHRLDELCYDLPSVSVGDVVSWRPVDQPDWTCATVAVVGFTFHCNRLRFLS